MKPRGSIWEHLLNYIHRISTHFLSFFFRLRIATIASFNLRKSHKWVTYPATLSVYICVSADMSTLRSYFHSACVRTYVRR